MESVIYSEVNQKEKNIVYQRLYVESRKMVQMIHFLKVYLYEYTYTEIHIDLCVYS